MINDLVIRGIELQEVYRNYGYTRGQGSWLERKWKGTEANIVALEPLVKNAGYSYTVQEGPLWELTARYTYDEELINRWSIQGLNSEKDILYSQSKLVVGLDAFELNNLREYVNNPLVGLYPAVTTAQGRSCAEHINYGINQVTVNQPVLRRSSIFSINANLTGLNANANTILTTPFLISSEGVPNNYAAILPNYSNPPVIEGEAADITLRYGWYKTYPSIQDYSYSRLVGDVEFIYGLWSTDMYDFA